MGTKKIGIKCQPWCSFLQISLFPSVSFISFSFLFSPFISLSVKYFLKFPFISLCFLFSLISLIFLLNLISFVVLLDKCMCVCLVVRVCIQIYVCACTSMFVQFTNESYKIYRDRERYSVSRYDSLIFNHETFTVLNQNCGMILVQNGEGFVSENQQTTFCVERLNLSMKIAKPIQEKQPLLYSFLENTLLKLAYLKARSKPLTPAAGSPSNLIWAKSVQV